MSSIHDLAYLKGLGFVDFEDEKRAKKAKKPTVDYDAVHVTIPISGTAAGLAHKRLVAERLFIVRVEKENEAPAWTSRYQRVRNDVTSERGSLVICGSGLSTSKPKQIYITSFASLSIIDAHIYQMNEARNKNKRTAKKIKISLISIDPTVKKA